MTSRISPVSRSWCGRRSSRRRSRYLRRSRLPAQPHGRGSFRRRRGGDFRTQNAGCERLLGEDLLMFCKAHCRIKRDPLRDKSLPRL